MGERSIGWIGLGKLGLPIATCIAAYRVTSFDPVAGIVRITTKRRHWTKNIERLCGTELAPLGECDGTAQLEIFAAVEMALLIEMIVYG